MNVIRNNISIDARDSAAVVDDLILSPEARLLLLCARTSLSREERSSLQKLAIDPKLDWRRFLELIAIHRVTSLVSGQLNAAGVPDLGKDFYGELARRSKAVTLRNFLLVSELVRLQRIFLEGGITAVWFKGPVLAQRAYDNPALRESLDLDVLIPRAQVDAVNETLLRQNYVPQFDLVTPRQQRLHERISNQHSFYDQRGGLCVDVHWAVSEHEYSFSNFEPLPTCDIDLAGHCITTFEDEATLCYLCYHGCKHGWWSLRWICDVAEFVRRRELDWQRLMTADRLPIGTGRMLRLGLFLAHFGLGARLPEAVVGWIKSDRAVWSVGRSVLMDCLKMKKLRNDHVYTAMMESWRDRINYKVRAAWGPTALELERVALPDSLFFVYRGLRYIRVTRKYLFERRPAAN